MKIAFVSCTNGIVHRGVETYVHELANSLSKNNEVIVYQAGEKLANSKYLTKTVSVDFDPTEENRLRSLSKPLQIDFNWKSFLRRFYLDYWNRKQGEFMMRLFPILDKDIEIIIIPGSGWVSLLCRIWTWFHGAKLIIAGQSGPGWDDRINLWCRPDIFIALSTLANDWAKNAGFGVKVVTIPNGVSIKRFDPETKPTNVDLPRPIYLSVAALEPGKRIDLTIRAIAELKKGSLLVLGDGNQKDELVKLANSLLPGRFMTKYVKHEEIPGFYASADVVTMAPVGVESFGIVYVEGMAMNKPIVASDDPIRREIIGNAGLFVDPKDILQYSLALEKAAKKNWKNIPRIQAERFSWDKIARQYEDLFKTL